MTFSRRTTLGVSLACAALLGFSAPASAQS